MNFPRKVIINVYKTRQEVGPLLKPNEVEARFSRGVAGVYEANAEKKVR